MALAAALALEVSGEAGAAALGLIGTTLAITFANTYADWLQVEIQRGERLSLRDVPSVAGHSIGVTLGALPALAFFVGAWLGLLAEQTAVTLSIASGIGLLFVLG